MKKLGIFLVLLLFLFVGCSKDYSGDYLNLIREKKTYYKDSNGKLQDPENTSFVAFSMLSVLAGKKEQYQKVYKYETIKLILSLKQEKTNITGKLTMTDDRRLIEFEIKSGYVDSNEMMHLKLMYQPQATAGVSAYGFSLSGPLNEVLINMDQVENSNKEILAFNSSGAVNLFGVLASEKGNVESVSFTKVVNNNFDLIADKYIAKFIESEIDLLKKSLEQNDIKTAAIHRDLVLSLNGKIPDNLEMAFHQ